MLHRHNGRRIFENFRFEANRVEIESTQIIADGRLERGSQLPVGVDLALHARAQCHTEGAGMSENEFEPGPTIEKSGTDHAEKVDRAVEKIAGHNGQFIVTRAFLARWIGRVDKKRHVQLKRGLVDGIELLAVEIDAPDIRGDVCSDATQVADAAAK